MLQKKLDPLQQLCSAHESTIEAMEKEIGQVENLFLLAFGTSDFKTKDGKFDLEKLSHMMITKKSTTVSLQATK